MADNVIVVENNNHLFRNKIRFDGKDENRHILEENMQAVCSAQTNQTLANLTYCLLFIIQLNTNIKQTTNTYMSS